jgi:HEPN domain-containing protein
MELALKMLEEAREYVSKGDAVQASEKLYKAAEESLKSIAYKLGLDVAKAADERGTVSLLFDAATAISEEVGEDVTHWWDSAWILHVEGFHEAGLSIKHVNTRISDVERIVQLAKRLDTLKSGETKPLYP